MTVEGHKVKEKFAELVAVAGVDVNHVVVVHWENGILRLTYLDPEASKPYDREKGRWNLIVTDIQTHSTN